LAVVKIAILCTGTSAMHKFGLSCVPVQSRRYIVTIPVADPIILAVVNRTEPCQSQRREAAAYSWPGRRHRLLPGRFV